MIPRNIDLVVGIPRSGLLPASLLATYLECPLTDVDGLLSKRLFSTGRTRAHNIDFAWDPSMHVLIVDDSIDTGKSVETVKDYLKDLSYRLTYCAVYASPDTDNKVDVYLEICPKPRVFQWNIMHHHIISESCVDIDGVLCRDPLPEENDDGERYQQFLVEVEPLFIPSIKAKCLVTNRLEKYRDLTEQWLAKYQIQYEDLVMMNVATKEERLRLGRHGAHKSEVYKASAAKLFIESSLKQSIEIASRSGKPALCVENWSIITPDYRPRNFPYHIRQLYYNHGYKLPYFAFWQNMAIAIKRRLLRLRAVAK